jgi:site-specific DNA-adenine methylase
MAETPTLKAPFPYFGKKDRIASTVWSAFGRPKNYVEPFCGSAAVLLARPPEAFPSGCYAETINDSDGRLVNLWRSIKAHPDYIEEAVQRPVSEVDCAAMAVRCVERLPDVERMRSDLDYCDPEIAAYWLCGMCWSIGNNWTHNQMASVKDGVCPSKCLPLLTRFGHGIAKPDGHKLIPLLANRLKRVRITQGDWRRVVTNTVLGGSHAGINAVFLDPPYGTTRDSQLYAHDSTSVHQEVGEWCRQHERDPGLCIVLCGYEGEHDLPGWTDVPWKTAGGFSKLGNARGRTNATRERLWLSPNCLSPDRAVSKAARAKLARLARGKR